MTDEEMKRVAEFYNEVSATADAIKFLKNCASFRITSGSQECNLSNVLQYLIREAIEAYYKELKEKQKEL
jgi:hypothetical protein